VKADASACSRQRLASVRVPGVGRTPSYQSGWYHGAVPFVPERRKGLIVLMGLETMDTCSFCAKMQPSSNCHTMLTAHFLLVVMIDD
jgi:hypothetical protein